MNHNVTSTITSLTTKSKKSQLELIDNNHSSNLLTRKLLKHSRGGNKWSVPVLLPSYFTITLFCGGIRIKGGFSFE